MNASIRKPLARFTGLLLLSLLIVVLSAGVAQSMRGSSSGVSGGLSAGSATGKPPQVPTEALNQGVGTSALTESGTIDLVESTPSGALSTTAWVAIGAAAAVLIIALFAWTMSRRRRRASESGWCALHPEDSMCRVA
jgi:hypothetical protein